MKNRFALVALVCAAIALAAADPTARAEVRRTTPQQSFSSGAMRSEQILREIASTLRSIDARVQRLETAIKRLESQPGVARVR